jgi:hypothetical protein
MLEKDKWVIIYQKPYTDEQQEGQAVLENRIMALSDGYERWNVRFAGETEVYERTVHPRHLMI